jgi:hypothetical protein
MVKTEKFYKIYEITNDGLVKEYTRDQYCYNYYLTEEEAVEAIEERMKHYMFGATATYTVLPYFETVYTVDEKDKKPTKKRKSRK